MNLLLIITIGTFIAFLVQLSVSDLRKKRMQMYKEKYEKAIKSGDMLKIMEAGREYHAFLQPQVQESVIESFIQKDISQFLTISSS